MLKRIALVAAFVYALAACGPREDAGHAHEPADPASADRPAAAGQIVSTVARANAPAFLWVDRSARATQSRARPASAAEAARAHLASFASVYRLLPDDVKALELRDLHDTGRGAIIARFRRRIAGLEVFGEQVAVAMDRN